MTETATALVVDDEEMTRAIVGGYLARLGYRTMEAGSIAQAWDILSAPDCPVGVLLLDRRLPDGDGLELLPRMRALPHLADLPVIVQSVADSGAEIAAAIRAGIFHYVIKPYDGTLLRSVVSAAVENHARLKALRGDVRSRTDAMALMCNGRFRLRTPQEARDLAIALSAAAPAVRGLTFGLTELLLNAVEHGTLGVGFEAKGRLKAPDAAANAYAEELDRRLASPHYRDRFVTVEVERDERRLTITITDMGAGFDHQRYLTADPALNTAAHGRGIALARLAGFAELTYLGDGNRVVGVVDLVEER